MDRGPAAGRAAQRQDSRNPASDPAYLARHLVTAPRITSWAEVSTSRPRSASSPAGTTGIRKRTSCAATSPGHGSASSSWPTRTRRRCPARRPQHSGFTDVEQSSTSDAISAGCSATLGQPDHAPARAASRTARPPARRIQRRDPGPDHRRHQRQPPNASRRAGTGRNTALQDTNGYHATIRSSSGTRTVRRQARSLLLTVGVSRQ